jgi:hypothetical protein
MTLPRTMTALCLLLAGCEAEHIANYPPMSSQQATQILLDRSRSIKSISAQGLITLARPDGQTVRLDAAMAIQPPGNARLRAWKLGQAVFDITLTPQGLWMVAPPEESSGDPPGAFGGNTAAMTRRWLGLLTGTFEDPGLTADDREARLILKRQTNDGATIVCEIDRESLTARRYVLRDGEGRERFTLTLSRYAEFNGIAWPRRIEAISPSGRILIDLHDVEINGALPSGAFHPPGRAVKVLENPQ